MNLEELYKLCSKHGSVMLAERDEQTVVDWLPNLHADDKILGEIVFDDITSILTVIPYLPVWCKRNPEQVQYYVDMLHRDLIEYPNAQYQRR